MTCNSIQPLLSEFIDNSLSARSTWEVDRHLADCNECTRTLNELRRTVTLVGEAPRAEVSEYFMMNLQSRLAALEHPSGENAWLAAIKRVLRPRVLPAWAAVATCTLSAAVLIPQFSVPTAVRMIPGRVTEQNDVQVAAHQNVAFSASDPFADIGAANLTAHVSSQRGSDTE